MKRYFVIETVEQMRTISDGLRLQLLSALVKNEYTGKQLGDLLGVSASKIHYHLKEMEQHGFIEVVRTAEKSGIIQKFYRATAYDFMFSDELLPSLREDTMLSQESMINHLRSGITRVQDTPERSFRYFADEVERPPLFMKSTEVQGDREELNAWIQKFDQLLEELGEIEKRYHQRVESGQEQESGDVFYMVNVGFMTTSRMFTSEDSIEPEGYRKVSDGIVKKK